MYDKSLKKCSSLLLTKEKYTSEPLASKNRIKSSKTIDISLITQMGAASRHSAAGQVKNRNEILVHSKVENGGQTEHIGAACKYNCSNCRGRLRMVAQRAGG